MIRQGASETRDRATVLKDMAESLTTSVAETASRMRTLETEATEDQSLAKEVSHLNKTFPRSQLFMSVFQALEKANQAKSISADSSVKVRDAISAVNEILVALGNMGSIGKRQNTSQSLDRD